MNVSIVGCGLIGGSLAKAARRAGFAVSTFDRGDPLEVAGADVVFVAVPPSAVADVVRALDARVRPGTVVVDVTGVKESVLGEVAHAVRPTRLRFVGGHPMAGREKSGYAHSTADLFDGASMILVPPAECPLSVLAALETLLRDLGFARIVVTDARRHDEMIAYTSQLCHILSSAYVREPLARDHVGYSAGSFRDLSRVGAPDPDLWTDLFLRNRFALGDVLDRCLARLASFRRALRENDAESLRSQLEEGVRAKDCATGFDRASQNSLPDSRE